MSTSIWASKRLHLGLIAVLLASLPMLGCEESYSSLVQYNFRTDPLILNDKAGEGEERYDQERPGQLPLMSAKDLLNPTHPLYKYREKLVKQRSTFRDPMQISETNRNMVKGVLDSWFGTPRNPKVKDSPESLKLDDKTLAHGSSLYRVHCLHCHGVSGDGRGVTARWIAPHPRDFRSEMFKFQSVDQKNGMSPPRREDLRRTLQYGIEATAMPAFTLLQPAEIESLISYVIHLSIRGKVEFDTIVTSFEEFDGKEAPFSEDIGDKGEGLDDQMTKLFNLAIKRWERSPARAIKIKPNPIPEGDTEALKASVERGYLLFKGEPHPEKAPLAKNFNCVSCHKDFGRDSTFRWDAWGTLARPNNLTDGIYRGGRRTIDLYHRIHSGINGSGMPAYTVNEEKDEKVIWDLINFVQTLPHPAMRERFGIKIN